MDTVLANYAIPEGTPGCPSALVAFSNVSLLAITAYKSFSGPTALAVALSLINSITTIISKMEAQTKELIKRIETRGEDMICSRLEGDELPPPSCRDSLSCNSAGAVRTLKHKTDWSDGGDQWADSASTTSSTKSASDEKMPDSGSLVSNLWQLFDPQNEQPSHGGSNEAVVVVAPAVPTAPKTTPNKM